MAMILGLVVAALGGVTMFGGATGRMANIIAAAWNPQWVGQSNSSSGSSNPTDANPFTGQGTTFSLNPVTQVKEIVGGGLGDVQAFGHDVLVHVLKDLVP
jgi:hypothetical protein